jgi:hypothetical protein
MTALEQANELQQQAIELLLAERQAIDERLAQLGQVTLKKRGRKPREKGQEKDPSERGQETAALPLR